MKNSYRPIAGIRCDLGEGLVWDRQAMRLLMTDIANNMLLEIDLEKETHRQWGLPEPVGWVVPTEQPSRYLVGLRSGIALFHASDPGDLQWLNREFPGDPHCRLNDACADSTGRIWFGSMNFTSDHATDGRLASFSPAEGLRVHDAGFTVTNGPLVAPEGQSLYFSDTLTGVVYRYALSLEAGMVASREVFIRFGAGQGFPDGMCFDAEGNLWIALWGAASIVRVGPDGCILTTIEIPAINVTNVCFGGESLDRMFVSTATIGMDAATSMKYPGAGHVFEITNHKMRGIFSHSFKVN